MPDTMLREMRALALREKCALIGEAKAAVARETRLAGTPESASSPRCDCLSAVRDAWTTPASPLAMKRTAPLRRRGESPSLAINGTWGISLGRGLDIRQYFDAGNALSVESGVPKVCKAKELGTSDLKR